MEKNQIVNLIKENLFQIIPELAESNITTDDNFVMLGLNSIDKGELISLTVERMELKNPRIEFVGAQTINELADIVLKKQS